MFDEDADLTELLSIPVRYSAFGEVLKRSHITTLRAALLVLRDTPERNQQRIRRIKDQIRTVEKWAAHDAKKRLFPDGCRVMITGWFAHSIGKTGTVNPHLLGDRPFPGYAFVFLDGELFRGRPAGVWIPFDHIQRIDQDAIAPENEIEPTEPIREKSSKKVAKSLDFSTVYRDNNKYESETNNHKGEPQMITITGNYFQDLNAAIEAGLIERSSANPKKSALIAMIEAHNAAQAIAPAAEQTEEIEQFESALTSISNDEDEISGEDLLALDAAEDAAIAAQAAEKKAAKQPRVKLAKPAAKSLERSEVWSAEAIGAIKRDSFNGKVLLKMVDSGVTLNDYAILGLPSKRQVSQAIACISEKGYGVNKQGETYFLVMPENMSAPKLS